MSMRVVITGGGGFLGQVLCRDVLRAGTLRSGDVQKTVTEVVIADIVSPKEWLFAEIDGHPLITVKVGDVSDRSFVDSLLNGDGDNDDGDGAGLSIFHLGAVMSGQGEADFDLAMRVNLQGTMNMLESARQWHASHNSSTRPTFIFTSAGATIGSGASTDWVGTNDTISDSTRTAPHTTYGMTKSCCELLLADYSRRKFVDGRGVRLPTVVVRAGAPNAATTGCFSGVIREPLAGKEAVMPINESVEHACTGYRTAIQGIIIMHNISPSQADETLGYDRTVFLPSRALSLGQLTDALYRVVDGANDASGASGATTAAAAAAADGWTGPNSFEEDSFLSSVVGSFPTKISASRALSLGIPPCPDPDTLIRHYCEDFPGAIAPSIKILSEDEVIVPTPSTTIPVVPGVLAVALVTGGGSGIGRSVAVRLSRGGWEVNKGAAVLLSAIKGTEAAIKKEAETEDGSVGGGGAEMSVTNDGVIGIVLAGRTLAKLEETAALCMTAAASCTPPVTIKVLCLPTDVTNDNDVDAMYNAITSEFGRLDLLFNNAGINVPALSVEDLNPSDFRRVIDTNLTACFTCARGAMKVMKDQAPRGGRIINNGSISADRPRPGTAPYTASKHAITGLTKSIALDGRAIDVACGQIDFGNVKSDMTSLIASGCSQANGSIMAEPCMAAEDAAETVFTMASLPLSANILQMTVMATKMPLVGRG
eukprot:CAMPEP_0182599654 /NCGR_PEP_ID=MMETSP1324-20130603/90587_1 /TAXON_ID=236786 /ORGANISM="Florenciella sp., Strain RCC1587" /LENGTH=707 /DNA_ID=CAMNT_0024817555 /DNA_START=95 /DNA_END=2219 /DNA_ORIENTATION=-